MAIRSCVQYGCGLCCPAGWVNYDCSFRMRLERAPLVGRLIPTGPYGRFPGEIRYGDIVRGLPRPDSSVDFLYCSHVLDNLSLVDLRKALVNSRRLLAPAGVFRMVLPNLEQLIRSYVESERPDRAITFIRHTGMVPDVRYRGFQAVFESLFANRLHLWLWDYEGLAQELQKAGFVGIRRAEFNDSGIDEFKAVEVESRWRNFLGIQCSV